MGNEYLFKRNKKQIEAKYLNHLKKENLTNEDNQSNFSYDYVDCIPTGNIDNDVNDSEFFSFENLDIDNFKLISEKENNKEINFDKKDKKNNNEINNTYNNAEFYNNKRKFVEDELISVIKIT